MGGEGLEPRTPSALPALGRVAAEVWVAIAADAVLRLFPDERRWGPPSLPTRGVLGRHLELAADGAAWPAYANVSAVDPKGVRVEVLD